MAKIELDLSSEDAELILTSLYLRMHQKGIREEDKTKANDIRRQLNTKAEIIFGWCNYPERWGLTDKIRVNVVMRNRW